MNSAIPENILRHELIGLNVKVARASNWNIRGTSGLVIDESKNMITLLRKGRKILIPKSIATFRFRLSDGCQVEVEGTRLIGRPENRLKTKVRRW